MRTRFLTRPIAWYAFAASALIAAGCSGGGGSSAPPTPAPSVAPATAPVTFSISVGSGTGASSKRRPHYVSVATKSVAITPIALGSVNEPTTVIDIASGAPGCSGSGAKLTCTGTLSAPIGQTSFNVVTYAATGAKGGVLSTGTITIVVGSSSNEISVTNQTSLTLNAAPARFTLSASAASLQLGTPSSLTVTATVYDAAGEIIIGGGSFTQPIDVETIAPGGQVDPVLHGTIGASAPGCTYPTPTGDVCYLVGTFDGPGAPQTLSYEGESVPATSILLVGESPGLTSSALKIALTSNASGCTGSPISVCPGLITFANPASSPVPLTVTESGVSSFEANDTDCFTRAIATVNAKEIAFGSSFTVEPITVGAVAGSCTITISDSAATPHQTIINVTLVSAATPTPSPSPSPAASPTSSPTPTPIPSGPITIAPSSTVEFASSTAAPQTITASQPGFSSFTIDQTACAGIATVSPTSGTQFTVTPVAALTQGGECTFEVKDSAGQSSPVTVYVDGAVFHIN
jgi:hypothetical protein